MPPFFYSSGTYAPRLDTHLIIKTIGAKFLEPVIIKFTMDKDNVGLVRQSEKNIYYLNYFFVHLNQWGYCK